MENQMDKEQLKQQATKAYLLQQVGTVFNATLLRTMMMHLCLYDRAFAENAHTYLDEVEKGTLDLIAKGVDKNVVEYMSLTLKDMVEDYKLIVDTAAKIRQDIAKRAENETEIQNKQ